MRGGLFRRAAMALAGAALLGGCAFRPQLHAVAVDHNRLVADTANELTLLNILRARARHPMHFTSMNVLRGNAEMSVGAAIGGDLVDGAADTLSPSLDAGAATNPSFDIAIYDKKEFQAGIMTPVAPSLYQYFLSNGWPPDYLARLLIERIEFRTESGGEAGPGTLVGVLENDPEERAEFARFLSFLAQYDVTIHASRAAGTPIAPAADLLARSTLAELSILSAGALYIEPAGEAAGMIMRPGGIDYRAVLVATGAAGSPYECSAAEGAAAQGLEPASSPARFQWNAGRDNPAGADAGEAGALAEATAAAGCTFLTAQGGRRPVGPPVIVLRSPDAVMYYLGEYIRDPALTGETALLRVWREGEPGAAGLRPVVRTRFLDQRWFIADESAATGPGEPDGRSMQTLSFVQQLINLHKSAEELPVSSSLVVQQ